MNENNTNSKPFIIDYRVEEIDHETYRLRPNLEVKAAGFNGLIMRKYNYTLVCSKFEIEIGESRDFPFLLKKLEYLMGDEESNVKKISAILSYLESNRDLINSITNCLNHSLKK